MVISDSHQRRTLFTMSNRTLAIICMCCLIDSVTSINSEFSGSIWGVASNNNNERTKRSWIVQDHVDFEPPLLLDEEEKDEASMLDYPATSIDQVETTLSLPRDDDDATMTNPPPKSRLRSTGTTIAGLIVQQQKKKNGCNVCILGADTRATDDRMVADKYCSKIHDITPAIFACGAGTSGDLEAITRHCKYSMRLQQMQQDSIGNGFRCGANTTTTIGMNQVVTFLKNQLYESGGSLGVNLILGSSSTLIALHPHGSLEQVPYAALGSGGLAAMAVLEQGYRPNLSLKEGKALIAKAIQAGIDNDLGSGSQVDLCIIKGRGGEKEDEVEYIRAAVPAQELGVEKSDAAEGGGVNGFGTLLHEEQSRRTVMTPTKDDDDEWNQILGL